MKKRQWRAPISLDFRPISR